MKQIEKWISFRGIPGHRSNIGVNVYFLSIGLLFLLVLEMAGLLLPLQNAEYSLLVFGDVMP